MNVERQIHDLGCLEDIDLRLMGSLRSEPAHGVITSPACVMWSLAPFRCNRVEMIASAALVWREDAVLSIHDAPPPGVGSGPVLSSADRYQYSPSSMRGG